MDVQKDSAMKFAILIFVIIASDMCKISDARGPIISLRCSSDVSCERRRPHEGCKCVESLCRCFGDPPKLTNNGNTIAT